MRENRGDAGEVQRGKLEVVSTKKGEEFAGEQLTGRVALRSHRGWSKP